MSGRYEGDWVDGKYDGYGVETWARGSRFRGQYRKGLRNGFGVYRFYTADVYAGEWSNGQSHGCGIHTCEDGSRVPLMRPRVSKVRARRGGQPGQSTVVVRGIFAITVRRLRFQRREGFRFWVYLWRATVAQSQKQLFSSPQTTLWTRSTCNWYP
ncbi:hypothetical protein Lal_00012960 [Lupinus albus]|nr:hypothetical protein Lal_00012960 [Lupinus albus]